MMVTSMQKQVLIDLTLSDFEYCLISFQKLGHEGKLIRKRVINIVKMELIHLVPKLPELDLSADTISSILIEVGIHHQKQFKIHRCYRRFSRIHTTKRLVTQGVEE